MSENFTGTWRTREESFLKDKRKCQIRKKSIVFLGHFISSGDIQVDHPKTEANSKTSALCQKNFDSNLPSRSRTNASSVGLGAFLEQNYGNVDNEKWHPNGYSSQALRHYRKWRTDRKENLSIVFGVERFHEYKSLKSFLNKPTIFYPPGKKHEKTC